MLISGLMTNLSKNMCHFSKFYYKFATFSKIHFLRTFFKNVFRQVSRFKGRGQMSSAKLQSPIVITEYDSIKNTGHLSRHHVLVFNLEVQEEFEEDVR